MKRSGIRTRVFHLLGLAFIGVLLAATASPRPQTNSSDIVLRVDPAQSKIHWTLGATAHTVHGTFSLKRGNLHINPATGKAGGEIAADATSGESGNDSRDKKMHKEVLESARFTEIVFRPDHLEGAVSPKGSSSVQLHGTFAIHGGEHELTVPVQAELNGGHWKGTAKFSVPYANWGLKNPSGFLLKVDPAVEIELELSGNVLKNGVP
jgi:polyisoprenoid-binding protein YceI